MPNRHYQRKLRHCQKRLLARLLPLSAFSFAVAASAQTTSSDTERTTAGDSKTPAANSSNTTSLSRAPLAPLTPAGTVSEVTIEEPGPPPNVPPSFYGASGDHATSSVGLPGFAASAPSVQSATEPGYPLQWGPFSFHPHLNYGFTYADGILVRPGEPTVSVSHALSPGLTILSRHLSLDYTPSLLFYSKGPYDDTVNHSANFGAGFGYNDWTFQLRQTFSDSSAPLIETGFQTRTLSFGTTFAANWNFSERWFFDFTLSQRFQDSEGYQSSRQWSTMEWANYRLTPQLSLGAGLGGGYLNVETGSDSTFEQIQGRINWHPSKKFSLDLNGGVEIRQFIDAPRTDSMINPIMGASMSYRVFEPTVLYLLANRSVDTSIYSNQITENSSVSGGINQRLFKYLHADISAGYRRIDYKGTFVIFNFVFPTLRQDDYSYVSTGLSTALFKKASVSLAYTHGRNKSSLPGYTYETDQVSFNLGYRF